jgi:hypothetical protein
VAVSIEEQIRITPLNAFQQELVNIERTLLQNVSALQRTAREAGLTSEAQTMLARAHEAAALAASQAVERLEAATRRLVQDVFGTPLSRINDQIEELQRNSSMAADSLESASDSMARLIAFADSLLVGALSPLPSRTRLEEGLAQLRDASETGDAAAVQRLAQQVLQIGRERFATGPEFEQLFNQVQQIIRATVPVDELQRVSIQESPELIRLFKERDRLEAEQRELDRRATAMDIAQSVADISAATGESFDQVAARLGFDLDQLSEAMGIDRGMIEGVLQSMQVDTSDVARTLEAFAEDVRNAIVTFAHRPPTTVTVVIDPGDMPRDDRVARQPRIVDTIDPPDDGFFVDPITPRPPKFTPAPMATVAGSNQQTTQQTDREVIENTARIARSTEALLLEMRRDQLRSSRTAVA